VCSVGDDIVVKFAKEGEKSISVTEVDKGIFQLERNEKSLEGVIQTLEMEKENALQKVKSCLKEQKKLSVRLLFVIQYILMGFTLSLRM